MRINQAVFVTITARLALVFIVALLYQAPAALGGPSAGPTDAWEQLDLGVTTLADTTVYYEKSLEPDLPAFAEELTRFLGDRDKATALLTQRGPIIADIDAMLGIPPGQLTGRADMFDRLGGVLAQAKLTLYLITQTTTKDYLRSGGHLPSFSYDKETNTVLYQPNIQVTNTDEPIETFTFCIPVSLKRDFREEVRDILNVLRTGFAELPLSGAIHEIVELSLIHRARPSDPYWRWFSDGFANALTRMLVARHGDANMAEAFAAAYDLDKYRDLEKEINLRYWMSANFCVYRSEVPVEREHRILLARYAYSMSEAERLIEAHGLGCVRDILDTVAARETRTSRDLLGTIEEVTGEDMAARLARYQTFTTEEDGLPQYTTAFNAAATAKDYEPMFISLMRIMELKGDVFSGSNLQSFKNAALFLFKMGHEEAADKAMQNAIELFSDSPVEHGREAALETFVMYALDCDTPQKAEATADELLVLNAKSVPCLAAKMLCTLRRKDLPQAQTFARQLKSLTEESSQVHRVASRVLAIDPNQANTYKGAP